MVEMGSQLTKIGICSTRHLFSRPKVSKSVISQEQFMCSVRTLSSSTLHQTRDEAGFRAARQGPLDPDPRIRRRACALS